MMEVEVKVALDEKEKEEVLKKLRKACSTERFQEEEDVFFISTHNTSLGVNNTLKLRRSDGEAKLIFKNKEDNKDLKRSLEFEVRVKEEDVGNLLQILRHLGFKESLIVRKRRISFYFNGCTVNVDDVEGLGSFLEVEVLSEDEVNDAFNRILEALSALGLSEKRLIRKSYAELISCRHDM